MTSTISRLDTIDRPPRETAEATRFPGVYGVG
jgi:hypothetical protein